jgi:hypothetical protein
MVPAVMQRDSDAVDANNALLQVIQTEWAKDFGPALNASQIPHLAPAKGASPNDVLEGVPLRAVLEDFLLKIQVKDPRDAEEHTAMLIALASLLAQDPDMRSEVFLMNKLDAGYRSRAPGRGLAAADPFAPINQYFSQSAGSVNDRSFCSSDRISLQLRRFNLGAHQRDPSRADIHNVVWFALHIPPNLKKALLVEQRD